MALLVSLVLFAGPLFLGLDRWDMQNDEAIQSYAVQRMLEAGDWLNPRSIPSDNLLVEKPPLKIWLVAGGMLLGLLPETDAGMRALDPLFGALAFVYVFLIGRRLAGTICGFAAVYLLFAFEPLLFEHGLRSNNMDAALLLAYAGCLYHAGRWAEAQGAARGQAWFAVLYFVLGFLMKYVMAMFLPVLAAGGIIWGREGLARARGRAGEWFAPAVGAAALVLPWFVYQVAAHGETLWLDMFVGQVYQRFTTFVDPTHVQPWYYYVAQTWAYLQSAGTAWLTAAGLALLAWRAGPGRDPQARVIAAWLVLPLAAISLSSSKILHYAYPFLPPLALAGGLAVATFLDCSGRVAAVAGRAAEPWLARLRAVVPPLAHRAALIIGTIGFLIALWVWLVGPVRLRLGGMRILQSSSILRPAGFGALAFIVGGQSRRGLQAFGAAVLLFAVPSAPYWERLDRTASLDRPVSTLAACLSEAGEGSGRRVGVYAADMDRLPHTYFYYLRHIGSWESATGATGDDIRRRLLDADPGTVVVLMDETWRVIRDQVGRFPRLDFADGVVVLLPQEYANCADVVADARSRGRSTGWGPVR